MAYINVPTSTDLVRNGIKILTVVAATCNKHDDNAAAFTIQDDGAYRITLTGIGTAFATGDWIVIRGSRSDAAHALGKDEINNDGIYEVELSENEGWIEVVKPVAPMTWKVYADGAAATTYDEIDTFILHPTKRIEQICVFLINSATTIVQVCFAPGPFWAASIKTGIPPIQGSPAATASYLFQVETAKYLQTKSEVLLGTAGESDEVNRKGTILMHVMPAAAVDGTTVSVGLIQLY